MHEEDIRADDETTLSGWFVYHWDAHSRTLFAPTGPFEFCRSPFPRTRGNVYAASGDRIHPS
ncbi:DUF4913 domain-containing protein [Arthrobacter ginsengisoli]|uniref:DUF4913 domain-containing protein n=1 Tax=Arthrobacter ginsengisoli TaxID=1356565 RepID=UPI00286AE6FF|nr:DUF4913 domain-containing protein [Arthrobacter ginsengisoli]